MTESRHREMSALDDMGGGEVLVEVAKVPPPRLTAGGPACNVWTFALVPGGETVPVLVTSAGVLMVEVAEGTSVEALSLDGISYPSR